MNKQEALEALLERMRGWEQPTEEVRLAEVPSVWTEVEDAIERLGTSPYVAASPATTADLVLLGAAALYLLVDEVTIVAGLTLDEWLLERSVGTMYRLPSGVLPGPGVPDAGR